MKKRGYEGGEEVMATEVVEPVEVEAAAPAPEPVVEKKTMGAVTGAPKVYFRSTPEIKGDNAIGSVNENEHVVIVRPDGDWTKVEYGGVEGFMMSKYIRKL